MNSVAAVLLAAGRSERMGAFKPLLPFGNKTVIQSSIDYLRSGGVVEIVVVTGYRGDELREHLALADVRFAENPDPGSEMSASIRYGVQALSPEMEATLITPLDHPAVPALVVQSLISSWKKGACLVVPTWHNKGGHPVLVDLKFKQQLLELEPARGLKALFDANRHEVVRLAVDSPYIARDMDTWDDYRALYEDVFHAPPPPR